MTQSVNDSVGDNDGVDGNGGEGGEGGNTVTPEAARALARGTKRVPMGPRRPWDKHDPTAKPEHRFTLRLNDYDRAIAHYVAGTLGKSVQNALIELLREASKRDITRREGVDSGIAGKHEAEG